MHGNRSGQVIRAEIGGHAIGRAKTRVDGAIAQIAHHPKGIAAADLGPSTSDDPLVWGHGNAHGLGVIVATHLGFHAASGAETVVRPTRIMLRVDGVAGYEELLAAAGRPHVASTDHPIIGLGGHGVGDRALLPHHRGPAEVPEVAIGAIGAKFRQLQVWVAGSVVAFRATRDDQRIIFILGKFGDSGDVVPSRP